MITSRFKYILAAAAALLIALLVLVSPAFTVGDVTVTGNKKLAEGEILAAAALDKPVNIFAFPAGKARRAIMENPYVESAEITKDVWERAVNVSVKERVLSGYVEYVSGTYLCIDENGRVLEATTVLTEKLPIVVGLDFKTFTVGQILNVTNKKSFNTLVTLAHLFNKYDMETSVIKVALHDENNTHLLVDNMDIDLGDIKDADEKIRTIKVILQAPEVAGVKGFLDIQDIGRPPRFKILT